MNDKGTILIVDDNLDNLNLLFHRLRQAGYEVMVAQDGASALKRVELVKPDLILLDVMMPDMDGFETATHLKRHELSQNIPIIFLTALNETANIVKGLESGGVDYLVKPFRMEEALARINTHLSVYKLQNRLEARTRELTSLLSLSHSLVSTLDLDQLAYTILDQLKLVVDYTGCTLSTLRDGQATLLAYRGPELPAQIQQAGFLGQILGQKSELFSPPKPLIVADVRTDERLRSFTQIEAPQAELDPLEIALPNYTRSWMGVPLVIDQQIIGGLSLCHYRSNVYTSQQIELVSAFADQAAIAIQNAWLYQQAQQVAIHEERNRLARTLHDSVTQSLFSASLIAEVLPQVWERDPDEGQQGLTELRYLTQGALAEMRTLLLELRPVALLKTRLDDLLRQLAQAVGIQSGIKATLDLSPAPNLPEDVHVTFYRIAQEAFNNIIKHAQPQTITVTLQISSFDQLQLIIEDDGRGFEAVEISPGRLGLEIMQERATQIGAELTVVSQPGQGTQITLVWPVKTVFSK